MQPGVPPNPEVSQMLDNCSDLQADEERSTFSSRLQARDAHGQPLTGADLARWFAVLTRPSAAGFSGKAEPRRGAARRGLRRGPAGQAGVPERRKQGLPVPRMTPAKRIEYINELRER